LPGFDNSAMDGYALRAEDVPAEGGYLMLAGRIAAGQHSTANAGRAGAGLHRRAIAARRGHGGAPGTLSQLWPAHLVPAGTLASTCASRVKNCAAARP
jgi:hypothetical protein